jgi:hypothetical protein
MTAIHLQRFIDRRQHAVGGVGGAGNVGVWEDGQELWRGSAQDAGRVDVADCAGQRGGHHLQRLFWRTRAVRLDKEDPEIPLITMGSCQLILEDGTHESVVEEARGPIDDVQRFGLRIVCAHSARRAEHSAVGKWGPASQARLRFRPPAQEVANRHRAKAYQPSGWG